ncbi:MAG: 3-oxoacyl-[acyl-carrier-protein] reductase [Verrucomicrobia bacterium]|jgi:3-oxoacyl-[acyl-carrier protein] reductase|nr:3-oxoacyl-[acyl-carrier-protein] reductase [Verrucomicrobiota bacterium]MDB4668902.1 3-oxoacyl-[acyl-carrier-protein] reductase [bacterium]MBT4624591.1 3-oxoacyl-[acyl-carrier-protein] reductase [Verrucomicrobiota bacterium]MBT5312124.1 3-oxoacyl-[acyl-carrier-protein] reductase [Verrucomicrobiota bacterium]MBT6103984.1 3-oxoacyl-[acyl-carrier-protein] reductase [Verrucomicrobiota bacterium]
MSLLADKIAVVTGAGRGIGRAVALAYAKMGADVVCVSRTEENSAKVAAEVEAIGRRAWAVAVDVSDTAAVDAAAKGILESTGRIDILVNNAGVTRDNLLMRMSEEEWDTVIDTNLKGAFNFTKALTRPFIKQRSGRIINIASVIGLIGNAGQSNYAASKAALIGFTKSIAKELATRGITVNAIAPGFIETDMTAALSEKMREGILGNVPLERFGSPDDIAHAAVFLAMEPSGYITGQVLTVDGGMVM